MGQSFFFFANPKAPLGEASNPQQVPRARPSTRRGLIGTLVAHSLAHSQRRIITHLVAAMSGGGGQAVTAAGSAIASARASVLRSVYGTTRRGSRNMEHLRIYQESKNHHIWTLFSFGMNIGWDSSTPKAS
jgi:hypothetical protein